MWARRDAGVWSIPKGEYESGEDPYAAARREFAEELGSEPPHGPALDLGEIRQRSGKLVRGTPKKNVTDGPYAEKDLVIGYTLIEASDLAQASELSAGCPILEGGGLVEVRPVRPMNL